MGKEGDRDSEAAEIGSGMGKEGDREAGRGWKEWDENYLLIGYNSLVHYIAYLAQYLYMVYHV